LKLWLITGEMMMRKDIEKFVVFSLWFVVVVKTAKFVCFVNPNNKP
jgi:hypothetical protein